MAAIELIELTKTFGPLTAVDRLDLSIKDKEFVALLGPSGCGKTTTMNMISGVVRPTSGTIRLDGRDIGGVPPGRRGIGFVFQNYAIFTHMTVRANLAFGLEVRRTAAAQVSRRVREMAELMRLSNKLDLPAGRLSVNELQRLAIGRSAIVRPEIFLLDEPLSNLDAAFRAEMRTELKHLQHEIKQTMVYVTHDQLEAMSMADRIAVIDAGMLQQYGSPLEIYNEPGNMFVARFIGSPSMNLLSCALAARDGEPVLDFGSAGVMALKDPRLVSQLRRMRTRELVLGVRPENLLLRPGDGAVADLRMAVSFVERIGARTVVHLERDGLSVKAVEANGFKAELGAPMSVTVPPGAALLFDAATQRRLRFEDR
jgi:multiple sugar transport system ATP-binding protein